MPANSERVVVPTNGAPVATVGTTKQDARAKMDHGGCFLPGNAYYGNHDGKTFKLVATYILNYVEGKAAGWLLIRLDAD